MFNFKSFPELEILHKQYKKLVDNVYKMEFKLEKRPNNELLKKQYDQAYINCKQYESEYESKIFDLFVKFCPKMYNRRTKSYEDWERCFSMSFETIPEENIGCLVCAVEETGGLYRFPPEYYE